MPNSVNATRVQVYADGTRVDSTATVADTNWYPNAHEGPNKNGIVLLSDNRMALVVMRLGSGDYAHNHGAAALQRLLQLLVPIERHMAHLVQAQLHRGSWQRHTAHWS